LPVSIAPMPVHTPANLASSRDRRAPSDPLKRKLLGGALGGAFITLSTACREQRSEQVPRAHKVSVVPTDLYLQDVLGAAFTLDQLKARAILLEFWATTCSICLSEMPQIVTIHETFVSKGLHVVALAMPYDRPDHVLHYAKAQRLPFPIAIDPAGHFLKAVTQQHQGQEAIEGTPTRLLINSKGEIIYREQGALAGEGQALVKRIRDAL
jgi:peroxiredoxin